MNPIWPQFGICGDLEVQNPDLWRTINYIKVIHQEESCFSKHSWFLWSTMRIILCILLKNNIQVYPLCLFIATLLTSRSGSPTSSLGGIDCCYFVGYNYVQLFATNPTNCRIYRIRLVMHHQISSTDVQYTLSCIQVIGPKKSQKEG